MAARRTCRSGARTSSSPWRPRTSRATARASSSSTGAGPISRSRIGVRYYPKVVVAVPFTPATGDRVLVAPGEDRARSRPALRAGGARVVQARLQGRRACTCSSRARSDDGPRLGGRAGTSGATASSSTGSATAPRRSTTTSRASRRSSATRSSASSAACATAGSPSRRSPPESHTREVARTMHGFYASTIDKHGMWGRLYLNEALLRRRRRALPRPPGLGRRAEDRARAHRRRRVQRGRRPPPLRPLLGRGRGRALPPLRRLLLRRHPPLRRAGPRRLRAGRAAASTSGRAASCRRLTRSVHWLARRQGCGSVIAAQLERERAAGAR